MPRRRSTRELGLAHVAGLVPEVPVIECWVRWLRHQDHPLPLEEALQMNKLLPASTLARRDQLPILVASKAVAANDLLFLCCHPDFALISSLRAKAAPTRSCVLRPSLQQHDRQARRPSDRIGSHVHRAGGHIQEAVQEARDRGLLGDLQASKVEEVEGRGTCKGVEALEGCQARA